MHEILNLPSVHRVFSKCNPPFALLTLQTVHQKQGHHEENWTRHDLWNPLITINLEYRSFYNPIDWSELYSQVYIPPWLDKIFDPYPLYMIWSLVLSSIASSMNFPKLFVGLSAMNSFFLKKKVPCFRGESMPLLDWKIIWGYFTPSIFARKWIKPC